MKHLKKFNEDYSNECSFEDFKDILLDVLDEFNFEYDFKNYSMNLDGAFYDCWIYLRSKPEYDSQHNIPSLNIEFLQYNENGLLPPTSSPEEITNNGLDDCVNSIEYNREKLETLKNNLDELIKFQKDCSKLFESLKSLVVRFRKFDNCDYPAIGFQEEKLRITFEIKG